MMLGLPVVFLIKQILNLVLLHKLNLKRRFYDGQDCKLDHSTFNRASLLRPWTSCFTITISA